MRPGLLIAAKDANFIRRLRRFTLWGRCRRFFPNLRHLRKISETRGGSYQMVFVFAAFANLRYAR